MEFNLIIGLLLLFIVGTIMFIHGIFGLATNRRSGLYLVSLCIGFIFTVGSVFSLYFINENVQNKLLYEVADRLEADPEMIIIEDMSKSGFLTAGKNESLRKAHYDGKVYMVEIEREKVIKIVETTN